MLRIHGHQKTESCIHSHKAPIQYTQQLSIRLNCDGGDFTTRCKAQPVCSPPGYPPSRLLILVS